MEVRINTRGCVTKEIIASEVKALLMSSEWRTLGQYFAQRIISTGVISEEKVAGSHVSEIKVQTWVCGVIYIRS
jgi:hypothetical protein